MPREVWWFGVVTRCDGVDVELELPQEVKLAVVCFKPKSIKNQ